MSKKAHDWLLWGDLSFAQWLKRIRPIVDAVLRQHEKDVGFDPKNYGRPSVATIKKAQKKAKQAPMRVKSKAQMDKRERKKREDVERRSGS